MERGHHNSRQAALFASKPPLAGSEPQGAAVRRRPWRAFRMSVCGQSRRNGRRASCNSNRVGLNCAPQRGRRVSAARCGQSRSDPANQPLLRITKISASWRSAPRPALIALVVVGVPPAGGVLDFILGLVCPVDEVLVK